MIGSLRRILKIRIRLSCFAMIAITLWLGGVGCALCCATGVTQSCRLDERNATDCCVESCCISTEYKPATGSDDTISQWPVPIGCSLLPDQARSLALLTRVSDDSPDGAPAFHLPFVIIRARSYPPAIDSSLPLNRGDTYLRCCVLLI